MEERYLTTREGHRLRYLTGGSGPPVLMVHPLQMIASANTWERHFPAVGAARTYYALDTLGWGLSDLLDDYSFDVWIELLRGFCDELQLQTVDLIGMSLGSWIAQLFAWRYPERVRRVAAIASPGLNPSLPGYATVVNGVAPTRETLVAQGHAPADVERILLMLDRPDKWANWTRLFAYLHDLQVREEWTLKTRLPQMQMPILFSNWDTNFAIPPRYTFEMFNLAPNARLEITTGGGDDLVAPSLRFLQAEKLADGVR